MSQRLNGENPHFTKSEQGLTGCEALEFFSGAIREKPRKTTDYSRAHARVEEKNSFYFGQDTKERRRKPRQLARGISNLLDDTVNQRPVSKYRSCFGARAGSDSDFSQR